MTSYEVGGLIQYKIFFVGKKKSEEFAPESARQEGGILIKIMSKRPLFLALKNQKFFIILRYGKVPCIF